MYNLIYRFLQKHVYGLKFFNFKILLNIQYFSILLYNNILYYVGATSLKIKEIKTSDISYWYVISIMLILI